MSPRLHTTTRPAIFETADLPDKIYERPSFLHPSEALAEQYHRQDQSLSHGYSLGLALSASDKSKRVCRAAVAVISMGGRTEGC